MAKNYPPVVIVDENDDEVGSAMLAEAWQKGLYHRGASVYVKDDQGRMLLQLRGREVKIYPNRWDQAAGGHVDANHSYEQTAINELAEELGLYNVVLKPLGTFRSNEDLGDGRINNQFERVYLAHVSHDVKLERQAEEVSRLQWFTPAELRARIAENPEQFTPGFLYGLHKYSSALGM